MIWYFEILLLILHPQFEVMCPLGADLSCLYILK